MQSYILMIEADPDDRQLTQEIFLELGNAIPIYFIKDSSTVFDYLDRGDMPGLIILDENAVPEPATSVLRQIKSHDIFKTIPVIMVSEHNSPQYREQCYALGANTVIRKPSTMQGTKDKIATFIRYWFEVAEISSLTGISA